MDYKALVAQGKYVGGRMDSGLERDVVFSLCDAVEALESERDAYKRAKEENDERFMLERDEARRQVEALEKDRERLDFLINDLQLDSIAGFDVHEEVDAIVQSTGGVANDNEYPVIYMRAYRNILDAARLEASHTVSGLAPTASTPTPAAPSDA